MNVRGTFRSDRTGARRGRRIESCHLDQNQKPLMQISGFLILLAVALFGMVVALQQRRFAYTARRSESSLSRRRARVLRSKAKLPCHLDQKEKSRIGCTLKDSKIANEAFAIFLLTYLPIYDIIISRYHKG